MNPVEAYLEQVRAIHLSGAGVPETSYYPALSNLLEEIGKTLTPKVRCIINLANSGAGVPDGGLFTADQLRRTAEADAFTSQVPARGAIEVKPPDASVDEIVRTPQLTRYLARYRQVLVTNLRDFALYGRDADGKTVELERGSLAADERLFWQEVEHPRALAQREGARLVECLKRVMLHAAPLAAPQDLAAFLASYARDARMRLEGHDLPALASLRAALEEALGMQFEGEKGEHFFRSTLVQTLFYGIFSAWVIWAQERPREDKRAVFDWRTASWSIELPVLRALFELISKRSTLQPLDLVPLIDSACRALNRVDRVQFFARFEEGLAVQYFYEPFLQAFDPDLRKQLGVWYTPPEIVQYQVARVDTVLREELEIADGLADPRVVVLDPCCGTGTYLVEVLKRIAKTLKAKGGDALLANDLKRAAIERVFGFEILPAPFVVAHLQLGLLLSHLGAPLGGEGERVGVYLTNALTGWEPPTGPKQKVLPFPDLEEEREAAEHVKRDQPILVILGNPPYNGFAGVSPREEQGLVEPYKKGLNKPISAGGWGIKKFNLDDLYVRFFRLAERRIAETTGKGIVSFISNFSYLGDSSFVVMRQRLLAGFDKVWLDCMNGDSRETGKLTPNGKPDPSVFSTDYNREGIRVGTVVCVTVRKPTHQDAPTVKFRHFWGVTKRADLLASLGAEKFGADYATADPQPANRFSFRPENVAEQYTKWPRLVDLCGVAPSNGLMEKRAGALIDIDRDALEARMRDYFDPCLTWDEYRGRQAALTEDAARFSARAARAKATAAESFRPERLQQYTVRPFDNQWCYYTPVRPVWNEPRPTLWRQCFKGNAFVLSRVKPANSVEGAPMSYCRGLSDDHLLAPDAVSFPLRLPSSPTSQGQGLFDGGEPTANLSGPARAYLLKLGIKDPDGETLAADLIWMHALAVGYSPAFLIENAHGIRRDWPRVPLPATRELLESSAVLGRQIAALLDPESDVPGVNSGDTRAELRAIGAIASASGKALDPTAGDLAVNAGWGHAGKGGITMPGRGRSVERAYASDERAAIEAGAAAIGLSAEQVFALLGERCLDVALNDRAYWRCVPSRVWEYTIGGYQVLKKWLSYRERDLLGRDLTSEEARYFTEVARRIAALLLLTPQLDDNYEATKSATYPWR